MDFNNDTISAGGDAAGKILDGIAHIKNGDPDNITNNTYNTYESNGSNTTTIVIIVAVLIVAVVGVVLFTRK